VGDRPRDDDVVTLTDLEGPEDGLDPRLPALDVDALVADGVAIPRRIGAAHGIREPDIPIAHEETTSRDGIGGADDGVGLEEVMGLEVTRHQRMVGRGRQVADGPLPDTGDGRRDVAVVEQAAVGRETLLTHELFVVELAGARPDATVRPGVLGAAVLRVPLGRNAAHGCVVRHQLTSS